MAFLGWHGLTPREDIVIDIVARLPDNDRRAAAGLYREDEHRVLVLSYAEFAKLPSWSDLSIDETLYRSLVAHEVAHAIAAQNFTVERPSILAKEYVAYVTMFMTMPPEQRARLLERFKGAAFEGEWQMNLFVYLIDPLAFGARAYRHFISQSSGGEYLERLLRGQALRESAPLPY